MCGQSAAPGGCLLQQLDRGAARLCDGQPPCVPGARRTGIARGCCDRKAAKDGPPVGAVPLAGVPSWPARLPSQAEPRSRGPRRKELICCPRGRGEAQASRERPSQDEKPSTSIPLSPAQLLRPPGGARDRRRAAGQALRSARRALHGNPSRTAAQRKRRGWATRPALRAANTCCRWCIRRRTAGSMRGPSTRRHAWRSLSPLQHGCRAPAQATRPPGGRLASLSSFPPRPAPAGSGQPCWTTSPSSPRAVPCCGRCSSRRSSTTPSRQSMR
jgi:hypothetical protein